MLPIDEFRTLALSSRDLEVAERFYTDVLGGTVVERFEPTEGSRRPREVVIQLGTFRVALANVSLEQQADFPHYTLASPSAPPRSELLGQLEAAGVTVQSTRELRDGTGWVCNVRDPDGHLLEIWIRHPEQHPESG